MTAIALTAEEIFRIHPKINWVGLGSDSGETIFSENRPGVSTPEEDNRFLLELGAIMLTGVAQRSDRWVGDCEYISIAYEKATRLIVHVADAYLALTLDKSVPSDEVSKVAESVRILGKGKAIEQFGS